MGNETSSILINGPVEKTYKMAETYPMFVKFYDHKKIVKSNEKEIVVDVGYRFLGIPIRWRGIGKKEKNKSIKYAQTKGILKGLEAHWFFITAEEGTKVAINTKFNIPFILAMVLGKRIRKITDSILSDLKTAVEGEN